MDDTIYAATSTFIDKEDRTLKEFLGKDKQIIDTEGIKFNGMKISNKENGCAFTMRQKQYIEKIEKSKFNKELSFDYFRRIRAKYAHSAICAVPHILIFLAFLSQITEERFKAIKSMAMKILNKLQVTATTNRAKNKLKYIHIPPDYINVVACTDASFAGSPDRPLQIGIFSMLRNKMNGTVKIIYFTSTRSKRVFESVLAAELFPLVDGYNIGYTTAYTLGELYGRAVNSTI